MPDPTTEATQSRSAVSGTFWSFVGMAGFAACLTVVSRSMRAVMDIGGYCAEGGPYEIARPCPDGVPALMIGGIWGGVLFLGVYAYGRRGTGTMSRLLFAWTALFAALGWNFLEYGIDPPDQPGIVWGWLIPGILFELMSGLPFLPFIAFGAARRAWRRSRGLPTPEKGPFFAYRPAKVGRATPAPDPGPGSWLPGERIHGDAAPPAHTSDLESEPEPRSGVATELERLAALHSRGEISDAEYAAAKAIALGTAGDTEERG